MKKLSWLKNAISLGSAEFLNQAANQHGVHVYVQRILSEIISNKIEYPIAENNLVETLSAPGPAMLEPPAPGKTNKEIAKALVWATGTEKNNLTTFTANWVLTTVQHVSDE